MNRKTKINLVVIFVAVISMVTFYKYDTGKTKKIVEQLNKEFSSIAVSEQVSGVVSNIYHPYPEIFNDDPLHAYVLLNDSVKKRIRVGHELARLSSLDSLLKVGDLLIKKYGSDTLYICKVQGSDTLRYSFQLRDDLGWPIRKKR
jgi:hypothetical protein